MLDIMKQQYDPAAKLVVRTAQTPGYHTRIPDGARVHPTRDSADYAIACLARDDAEHRARGGEVIDALLALQDADPMSRWFGLWGWVAEEPASAMDPADYNWADFIGARLAQALVQFGDRLGEERRGRVLAALDRAAMCIYRRNSDVGYTNIAVMGAGVCGVAGELLGRPVLLDYGRAKLRAVLELARRVGTFSEYNSPTYTLVALEECERIMALARDGDLRETALSLHREAWRIIAEHWHPGTLQWAGPHGRAYSDRLQLRTRRRLAAAVGASLGLGDGGGERVASLVPVLPCPEEFRPRFTEPIAQPRTVTTDLGHDVDGVRKVASTWLAPTCCLSCVTREHTWTQRRQVLAYWPAGGGLDDTAVFKVQWLMDGREMPGMRIAAAHEANRALLALYPLHGCGAWHPIFHAPPDSAFDVRDLRLRFALHARDAHADALSPARFELAAGDHRVRLDLPESMTFDGRPVQPTITRDTGCAAVDIPCVEAPRRVDFVNLRVQLAAALQLLPPGMQAVDAGVTLTARDDQHEVSGDGLGLPAVVIPVQAQPFSW